MLRPAGAAAGGAAPDAPKLPWRVEVVTSDVRGAGTDADIAVVLIGEGGRSAALKLLGPPGRDTFERAQTDAFTVEVSVLTGATGP